MHLLARLRNLKIWQVIKGIRNRGIALISSLLILLVLVLLGLTLLLQSGTENLIAINEQDSQESLMFAEEGLQLAKLVIFNRSTPPFTSFTNMLLGPDITPITADDNLIGFDLNNDSTVDLSTVVTRATLDTTNEQTTSVIETIGTFNYETFRRGIDTNGDGTWDGPTRAVVHVRIDDNWDETPTNLLVDVDKRIHTTAIAEYPIFLKSDGTEDFLNPARRGVADRTVVAEFGPQTVAAISTDGSLTLDGNVRVCGECGNIHANEDVTLTGCPHVCGDATASVNFSDPDCSGNVGGLASGNQPRIDIPVINPYDGRWVPKKQYFDTTIPEPGLPAILQCAAYDSSTNPGGTKYFALVADGAKGKVYKAYPDTITNGKWNWFLIDDLNVGSGVQLDDCGRIAVASGDAGALGVDATHGAAADDGQADQFYGFRLQQSLVTDTCSGTDKSLGGGTLVKNDYTDKTNVTPANSSIVLPGSCFHAVPGTADSSTCDSQPDFDAASLIPDDLPKRGQWITNSNDTWSPTYNAVIFVWGHMELSGNLATLKSSVADQALPNGRWRISIMATGFIDVAGTPAYATAIVDTLIPELFIAGRDVELAGNANGAERKCENTAGHYCDITGTVPSFAGFVGAHEQIDMSGNTSLDGFMIAEDAANCGVHVNAATGISTLNGNPSVHYDCIHPPNPFDTGIRALSWQEVQQ